MIGRPLRELNFCDRARRVVAGVAPAENLVIELEPLLKCMTGGSQPDNGPARPGNTFSQARADQPVVRGRLVNSNITSQVSRRIQTGQVRFRSPELPANI